MFWGEKTYSFSKLVFSLPACIYPPILHCPLTLHQVQKKKLEIGLSVESLILLDCRMGVYTLYGS